MSTILVFGGPYSNIHALDALLAEAGRRGLPPSAIVSTGDLVAYCADPAAVVARVRQTGIRFVRGNCEAQVAAAAADCGCGFAPGGACDRLSSSWYAHALSQLDEADRAFLGAAPERIDLDVNGVRIAVIHGAARSVNRFVFPSTPFAIKAQDIAFLGVDGVVAGHSGLPFTQIEDGCFWHNPGALGMPANDGTPRVWFSVVAPGPRPGTLRIEHAALDYDHPGAAAAMRRAGVPDDYALTLATGVWPNCDVMPKAEAAGQGRPLTPGAVLFDGRRDVWPPSAAKTPLAPGKFVDARRTADGAPRASVALRALETLWVNTGTLCNLACATCYVESSPRNDRLAYFARADLRAALDEGRAMGLREVGFTGGEPFLNRDLVGMLDDVLDAGLSALVLTNAMKPMRRRFDDLRRLRDAHGGRLALRVSLDHYAPEIHELERGRRSFEPTLEGLALLSREGFRVTVAGRLFSGEGESVVRAGFSALFAERGITLDAFSPNDLALFPEMDAGADAPEVDDGAWTALGVSPASMMCATSRMLVRRRGAARPSVVACTLLPFEEAFDLGPSLAGAARTVALNHPHCSTFCVHGGATCAA